MSTPQSIAQPVDSGTLHLAYAQDDEIERLPPFVALPLIALTSAGLWFLIYKAAWSVVSILR